MNENYAREQSMGVLGRPSMTGGASAGYASEPIATSPITLAFNAIMTGLEVQAKEFEELRAKLMPVTFERPRPESANNKLSDQAPSPGGSSIVNALCDINSRITSMRRQIVSLREAIEL